MWGRWMNGDRKPVLYCVKCGLEAVIDDAREIKPPCTNCLGCEFATAEEYDKRFLKSLKIAVT